MFFIRIFSIICLSLCIKNGISLYMGTEESLRQNIADLRDKKLKFSGNNLPFSENELIDTTPKNQSEYDFIVIGAGSAGATIASRLSEIKNFTVLLIEAGGKEYSIMDIPSMITLLLRNDEIDWNYYTESSDRYCLAQENGKCYWPRGKAMGGSSAINAMNAMRANRRDYDKWADEIGDDTWSYSTMLKYFKKLEDFKVTGVEFNQKYHRKGGPVIISDLPVRAELSQSFIKAGEEMGYTEVDFNAAEQIGFTFAQTTTFHGERWSANRAYLWPAKGRDNLHLTRNSHVHKILIDEATKIAYGVRYSKNGHVYEVKAKKEIILSAGSVNSPQILMLSGIGPAAHLRKLSINIIKDAPVGENLFDHLAYGRVRFSVNDSSVLKNANVFDVKDTSITNYLKFRNGTLSYGVRNNVIANLNVNNVTDMHSNLEMILDPGGGFLTPKIPTLSGKPPSATFSITPMILRPLSRGKILLRSKNPFDKPKIYPNYLENPEDIRTFIKGIHMAMKIGETNALKRHGAQYQKVPSTCDSHGVGSDKYWECELRHYAGTMQHPAGTCKMGRINDSRSVVDPKLKVIGIHGLRVADASIIPNPICSHLNIPTIAIGENAADLIKMEYGY